MTESVRLFESRGETSVTIDAKITNDGTLTISGHDVGAAPRQFLGDDDYEYWLTIEPKQKDRVILALLEHAFGGRPTAFSDFRKLVEAKKIPAKFENYV